MAALSSTSKESSLKVAQRPQCPFDAIVVTSPNERSAKACSEELKLIFERSCSLGENPNPLLLAVHDPDGNRIGSGGGTLNALDAAARALASLRSPSVNPIDLDISDVIECATKSRILIVHSGGDSQRSPLQSVCGKAWCALSSLQTRNKTSLPILRPGEELDEEASRSLACGSDHPTNLLSPPRTPIEILIGTLCRMSENLPVGSSVVACADVLLLVPDDVRLGFVDNETSNICGKVCGLAIAADAKLGPAHGCFTTSYKTSLNQSDETCNSSYIAPVERYLQKAPHEELIQCNAINDASFTVLVDTGVIAFDGNASKNLLLLTDDVLKGSTLSAQKRAIASNEPSSPAIRTELYSDFLLAVSEVGGYSSGDGAEGTKKRNFLRALNGDKQVTNSNEDSSTFQDDMSIARSRIWDCMHGCSFAVAIPGSSSPAHFGHLGTTLEQIAMLKGEIHHFVKPFGISNRVLVDFVGFDDVDVEASLRNGSNVMINTRVVKAASPFIEENTTSPPPYIGKGAVIEHCDLPGVWAVGSNSFVSGIRTLGSSSSSSPYALVALAAQSTDKSCEIFLEEVGQDILQSNTSFIIPPNMCVQEVKLCSQPVNNIKLTQSNDALNQTGTTKGVNVNKSDNLYVVSLLGVGDKVKEVYTSSSATICGVSWQFFFNMSGLDKHDIWDENDAHTLWQAKLFPIYLKMESPFRIAEQNDDGDDDDKEEGQDKCVAEDWRSSPSLMFWPLWLSLNVTPSSAIISKWKQMSRLSLRDILGASDPAVEFQWRHELEVMIGQSIVAKAMTKFVKPAVSTASRYALRQPNPPNRAEIATTNVSSTTDVANTTPNAVSVKSQEVSSSSTVASSNMTVEVECPVRIDVSGGWSDTPPICYEQGGSVVNFAVNVDHQFPIKVLAKVTSSQRISENITLSNNKPSTSALSSALSSGMAQIPPLILSTAENVDIEVWELSEMSDFNQPTAPGALLKAALIVAGIVTLPSSSSSSSSSLDSDTLRAQLEKSVGGSLRLESRSYLPVGSGMGTSSILAGAVLTALGHVSKQAYTDIQLVHAVLSVEQALTTGGGWQDQVGGCYPGVAKWCQSSAALPLKVSVRTLNIPKETISLLSDRLALIFTGKSRLAKNVLVEVVRRWWNDSGLREDCDNKDVGERWFERNNNVKRNESSVVDTARDLLVQAEVCAGALESGSLAEIGSCLSKYHRLKYDMAGAGYEPPEIKTLMNSLEPFSHGMSLCGAGGGGFLVVLTKQPFKQSEGHGKGCWEVIHELAKQVGGTAHSAQLVENGMKVNIQEY